MWCAVMLESCCITCSCVEPTIFYLMGANLPYSIPIIERVELPESWIPADSRVEIDAKINAGMFLSYLLPPPVFPGNEGKMTDEDPCL